MKNLNKGSDSYKDVLHFWFEECGPKDWFRKSDELDQKIRARFLDTYERVASGETEDWRETARGRLAEVLVLDQFARNMFRGEAKAFAGDALALHLTKEGISAGAHLELSPIERRFLYMPFMHSESKDVHKEAIWRFCTLLPRGFRTLQYEWKHKKIIDRFGRYPHRNEALGRESTPEEKKFLKTHEGF